jgi:hypothetical protein
MGLNAPNARTPFAAVDQPGPDDLTCFLKATPDGRYRLRLSYPQWFAAGGDARDLEAFARRMRSTPPSRFSLVLLLRRRLCLRPGSDVLLSA